jgi:transcriptional regulator with XRE-family HTH domain
MNATTDPRHLGVDSFGRRVKARRKAIKLTLADLALLSSVSASTISKVENGIVSPTYDVIMKLAQGLGADVSDMFGSTASVPPGERGPSGWRVIGRKNEYELIETENYEHHYLCSVFKSKRMVPIIARLKADSITKFGELIKHGGEEFIYVLKGRITLHSEFYTPAELGEGDYAYLDSRMGHAYLRSGDADATVLCICADQ